ncbi:MAG TPA: hypothetical protein PK605_07430 [Ignavibacteria bacterium]|nr:hypothetical protein [Bacteroidota bacterium]HRE11107.1 hypothetical protein [Ignavibacteria bacterium]HRF65908.1 hypothetical protein [Ignavibacteria bacterium]HRJ04218.1 hypothetical protein [Ignavibacteria bacterium]HRJ84695.1 hypothetical protein [Ignavibacteria bacterium]
MSILAGEKFELKLLPSMAVALHEECEDNRYSRLVERFNDEHVLYNPLIVANHSGSYILIDGANRFEALKQIGCKAILAQLVDYASSDVVLKSWYHFVSFMTIEELIEFAAGNKLITASLTDIRKPESKNELIVHSTSGKVLSVMLSGDLETMLGELSALNRFYDEKYSYTRIDSDTDISRIKELSPDEGLLFVFPELSKDDIVKIAGLQQKLPAGISRHLIPNRVLHIKILIDALQTDENIDKRNEELQKHIQHKIDSKKVRLYREPILVFDE